MKPVVYVTRKYPKGSYYNSYYAYTKIGALIKALWDTKGRWDYFLYTFD